MRYKKGQYKHMVKKNNISYVENQARYLAKEGRFDEAVLLLKSEIEKDCTNEHFRYELAKIYIKYEHYQEAIDELKVIEEPTNIKPFFVYRYLGNCYSFLSKYEEAYYYLLKAYYADTTNDEVLIKHLIIAGRKARLTDEVSAFLDSNPDVHDHDTIFQIIFFYCVNHKNFEALECIKKYNFEPSTVSEAGIIAEIYVHVYDFKTALAYVNRYDFFEAKNSHFFATKAVVKYFTQDYDEAYELFKKVYDANYSPSLFSKSSSWLARIELLKENIIEAKRYLDNLNDSPLKSKLKAEIEASQGNYQVAINILENEVFSTTCSLYSTIILYINILIRMKKYSEAKDVLQNYLMRLPYISEGISITADRFMAIIKKHLGEPVEKSNSYFINQVVKYSNIRSLNHIMLHYYSENGSGKFSSSFNINDEYFKIYNIIKNMEPIHKSLGAPVDKYLIDYPGAGVLGDISLDKIQVVTIMETKDIITFYPVSKYSLGYEYEEDFVPKKEPQKRLTQIEKFNQRYSNKNNN